MRTVIFSIILSIFISVSAFAKPPAGAFGQIPKVNDAAISPDGKKLAVYQNMEGSYGIGIYFIDGSGQAPFAIGMEAGVKPDSLYWPNNDIILASFWQSHIYQGTPIRTGHIYSLDINSKKGKVLVKPDNATGIGSRIGSNNFFRQVNNDVVDVLSKDPEHILMNFADEGNNLAPAVQKVNVRTGNYKRVRRGNTSIQEWITDLRGEVRVGQGRADKSKEKWTLRIRDAESDEWRSFDKYPGLRGNEAIYGFTSNPNEMILGRYNGKDTIGLYVYDLSQKSVTRKLFHHEDYDVAGVEYNSDRSEIIGASYIADSKQVELFGAKQTSLEGIRHKYPGYSVDYVDSNKDYSKVIVKLSSPSDPGGMFLFSPSTQKMQRISSMYDGLKGADMGEVISVKYTARDGQKIPAYVTVPPSVTSTPKGLPFIILPHGGPFARDTKNFDYLAQFFATRGFGVLQMNFRGSVGYGREFMTAGRKNWEVMQEDVEDGTRWLLEKGYADPERTCIAGWSYGGYAALIASIKNPDLYACTISMAGVTDLKAQINDRKDYRFGRITAKGYLKGFTDKDDLVENSPAKRADEMTGPVFLAHGTLDEAVRFGHYKRMKSALKKSKAKVTAIEFKDEDHYLSTEKNRVEFFEALDKFLKKAVGESEFAK